MSGTLFGRIVEHGLRRFNYEDTARKLYLARDEERGGQRKLGDGHPFLLSATIGATDLLEVAFSEKLQDLRQPPQQSGYTLWRPTGTYVPVLAELRPSEIAPWTPPRALASPLEVGSEGLHHLRQLVDHDPHRPIVAVCFSEVSPATLLFGASADPNGAWEPASEAGRRSPAPAHLIHALLRALGNPDLPIWKDIADPREMRVLPLVGLDIPDLVWFVRAPTVDDLLDFVRALREIRHLDIALSRDEEFCRLLGLERLCQGGPQEPPWSRARLFSATQTTLGLPWRMGPTDSDLILGDGAADVPVLGASRRAQVLVRARLSGGRRSAPSHPFPDPPDTVRFGAPAQTFGYRDVLWIGDLQPIGAASHSPLTHAELSAVIRGLACGATDAGLETHTLLAFQPMDGPPASEEGLSQEEDILGAKLSQTLSRAIANHRHTTIGRGHWTSAWSEFRARAGELPISASLDQGVKNLIGGLLDNLMDNLPDLLDIVDALNVFVRALVRAPEHQRLAVADLKRTYATLERGLLSRLRRTSPLHLQRTSLGFEGHAGYRMARDAYGAFVRDLVRATGRETAFLVTDFAEQTPTAEELIPGTLWALGVNSDILDEPALWLMALHELAHVFLQEEPVIQGAAEEDGKAPPSGGHLNEMVAFAGLSDLFVRRSDDHTHSQDGNPLVEALCDLIAIWWFTELGGDTKVGWNVLQHAMKAMSMHDACAPAATLRRDWQIRLSELMDLQPPDGQLLPVEPEAQVWGLAWDGVDACLYALRSWRARARDTEKPSEDRVRTFFAGVTGPTTASERRPTIFRMFDEQARRDSVSVLARFLTPGQPVSGAR